MAKKYQACFADEIPLGRRTIVDIEGRSVGIFNVNNEFFAVRNSCPHKGAPLCRGMIDGMVSGDVPGQHLVDRQGEIIRCPWHGWEFDLKTGQSVFNPHEIWVRCYLVTMDKTTVALKDAAKKEQQSSIETYPVSIEADNESERPMLYVTF